MDFTSFFATEEFDKAVYERFADDAHQSADARDKFLGMLSDYQATADAGGSAEALKLAIGKVIVSSFAEALDAFKKVRDSKYRRYYSALANLALGRYDDAVEDYERAAQQGWDAFDCDMRIAETRIRAGDVATAEKIVRKREREGADRADWYYIRGLIAERMDQRQEALEFHEKALTLDADHEGAMFRAAWLYDLHAEDDHAVDIYEKLSQRPRSAVNALMNLAVLYEDRGRFDVARVCLKRVLLAFPNHTRARLFFKDVESSKTMVIDDNREQRAESRNRILDAPIGEFELSVRARNCLKKMKVQSLGDLIRLSEAELMAYKNFGDTSLNEIRGMLSKKGLRLGMRPEEIDPNAIAAAAPPPVVRYTVPPGAESTLARPVSELELSVRARRCLQRLNIVTVGDLIQHSENDLLATRNFGQTSLIEIKTRLAELGVSLAPKEQRNKGTREQGVNAADGMKPCMFRFGAVSCRRVGTVEPCFFVPLLLCFLVSFFLCLPLPRTAYGDGVRF
ncbi:MAG: tetratricopeptide repeat protein, partial [Planctomycetes bacterium]|nr:tetratricopeptide repeat protein [Planctomycetota bacterium]